MIHSGKLGDDNIMLYDIIIISINSIIHTIEYYEQYFLNMYSTLYYLYTWKLYDWSLELIIGKSPDVWSLMLLLELEMVQYCCFFSFLILILILKP